MPYEIAGNAAGIDPERLMGNGDLPSDVSDRKLQSAGGTCDTVKGCLGCWFITGFILTIVGISKLSAATTDTRGEELAQWAAAMKTWTSTGETSFRALRPVVHSNGQVANTPHPPGPAPPTGWPTHDYQKSMDVVANAMTPSSFGESSWSDKKSVTVDSVTDVWFEGTAQCPGTTPNRTCTLNITMSNGQTIKRTLPDGAAWQDGPHTRQLEAYGCAWNDAGNPMATVGIGPCNTAGPDFGPTCVDPQYLDSNNCPSDTINDGYWTQTWFRLPFFKTTAQKRFTYDPATRKCWDYTDCFCTGCGVTFKSDTTKGIGFTGYGYYVNGGWVPFAKPMSQMSGVEKAQQCQAAMLAGGISCAAENVNLVCFNAGGYPKQPCSSYCATKGDNANYQSIGSPIVPWEHYPSPPGPPPPPGPPSPGPPPPPFNTQDLGTCRYDYIKTGQLKNIAMAIDSNGNVGSITAGEWTSGTSYRQDTFQYTSKPLHLQPTVPIALAIHSKDGPEMVGARITNGCNMKTPNPSRCFGPTQAENLVTGLLCLFVGLFLLCTPCLLLFACGNLLLRIRTSVNKP